MDMVCFVCFLWGGGGGGVEVCFVFLLLFEVFVCISGVSFVFLLVFCLFLRFLCIFGGCLLCGFVCDTLSD